MHTVDYDFLSLTSNTNDAIMAVIHVSWKYNLILFG
jgi:hypothetical protein